MHEVPAEYETCLVYCYLGTLGYRRGWCPVWCERNVVTKIRRCAMLWCGVLQALGRSEILPSPACMSLCWMPVPPTVVCRCRVLLAQRSHSVSCCLPANG